MSPTVIMRAASSSEMRRTNSSSIAMTSSTPSRPMAMEFLTIGLQPLRHLPRPVGDDQIRARALERGHLLHDRSALVEPAIGRGSFEHRVFAADVVDGGRQPE